MGYTYYWHNYTKMKLLNLIAFFLILNFTQGNSQRNINITTEKEDNLVKFYAENTSDVAYNIELLINSTGFKHTRECPIIETIEAKEKKYLTTLIPKKEEQQSYSLNLKYSEARPELSSVITLPSENVSQVDCNKGIIVFSKEGCGRCKHVEQFLSEKNSRFATR